jgi:hypothetical protein
VDGQTWNLIGRGLSGDYMTGPGSYRLVHDVQSFNTGNLSYRVSIPVIGIVASASYSHTMAQPAAITGVLAATNSGFWTSLSAQIGGINSSTHLSWEYALTSVTPLSWTVFESGLASKFASGSTYSAGHDVSAIAAGTYQYRVVASGNGANALVSSSISYTQANIATPSGTLSGILTGSSVALSLNPSGGISATDVVVWQVSNDASATWMNLSAGPASNYGSSPYSYTHSLASLPSGLYQYRVVINSLAASAIVGNSLQYSNASVFGGTLTASLVGSNVAIPQLNGSIKRMEALGTHFLRVWLHHM